MMLIIYWNDSFVSFIEIPKLLQETQIEMVWQVTIEKLITFSGHSRVNRDMSSPVPSPRKTLESPPVSEVNNSEQWWATMAQEPKDVRNTVVLWGMCLTGVSSYYRLLHPLNLPWPAPQRRRVGRAHSTCRQDSESAADRRRPPRDAQVAFLCASRLPTEPLTTYGGSTWWDCWGRALSSIGSKKIRSHASLEWPLLNVVGIQLKFYIMWH